MALVMTRARLLLAACLASSLGAARADDLADAWKAKCKSCHGEAGAADTKAGVKLKIEDLSDPRWQAAHSDEQIRTVIAEGSPDNPKMKAFKDKLTPEEISGLVGMIRGFARAEAAGVAPVVVSAPMADPASPAPPVVPSRQDAPEPPARAPVRLDRPVRGPEPAGPHVEAAVPPLRPPTSALPPRAPVVEGSGEETVEPPAPPEEPLDSPQPLATPEPEESGEPGLWALLAAGVGAAVAAVFFLKRRRR